MNFCIRNRELSEFKDSEVISRINANTRKLPFIEGSASEFDVRKRGNGRKTLLMIKEEKTISNDCNKTRLYGKHGKHVQAPDNFKYRIEEMLETLQTAVDEAEALDNVLQERRKTRMSV